MGDEGLALLGFDRMLESLGDCIHQDGGVFFGDVPEGDDQAMVPFEKTFELVNQHLLMFDAHGGDLFKNLEIGCLPGST